MKYIKAQTETPVTAGIPGARAHAHADQSTESAYTPAAATGEPAALQPGFCVSVVTSAHCSGPSRYPELPGWRSSR